MLGLFNYLLVKSEKVTSDTNKLCNHLIIEMYSLQL